MNINLSPLQKYLRTTSEARNMQKLFQGLVAKGFQTEQTGIDAVQQALPYEVATFVNKLFTEYHVDLKDNVQMQVFFKNLIATMNDLPVVSITLAHPPEIDLLTNIQEWFLREFNKLVLLDISIDPNLIAGGVISFKGKYYDCSLKKRLEQGIGDRP